MPGSGNSGHGCRGSREGLASGAASLSVGALSLQQAGSGGQGSQPGIWVLAEDACCSLSIPGRGRQGRGQRAITSQACPKVTVQRAPGGPEGCTVPRPGVSHSEAQVGHLCSPVRLSSPLCSAALKLLIIPREEPTFILPRPTHVLREGAGWLGKDERPCAGHCSCHSC